MRNLRTIRAALVAAMFAALTLSGGASPHALRAKLEEPNVVNAVAAASASVLAEPIDGTSTFYSVRRDLRKCVSPMCGGYFVKRVNTPSTRCANGRLMRECYVAEINSNDQMPTDGDNFLVRGKLVAKRYGRFGNLGELRVSESWKPLGANQPAGTFYRVHDRKVRCITYPCPTHSEAKLNSGFSRSIAGVNLGGAGLAENDTSAARAAMTGRDGLIVSGNDVAVTGPGGKSFELKATQAYVRSSGNSASMKPCIKTGCSSQVCSDENVITTCEYRPEYACYQKAVCERQQDGNCGFTKTRELAACLARK